jgi:hypothetical protein
MWEKVWTGRWRDRRVGCIMNSGHSSSVCYGGYSSQCLLDSSLQIV